MKLSEAMVRADELRPNTAGEEQKAAWLWALEEQRSEMQGRSLRPCRWPEVDQELSLGPPHEELYVLYLICKLDYYNQEMELYASDSAVYNAALAEAQAWWRRGHRPERKDRWKL